VGIAGDERLQLLDILCVDEMIKLDGILFETNNRIGAGAWGEYEIVIARPTDRNRDGLLLRGAGMLRSVTSMLYDRSGLAGR
jgi:hypothetical protein